MTLAKLTKKPLDRAVANIFVSLGSVRINDQLIAQF